MNCKFECNLFFFFFLSRLLLLLPRGRSREFLFNEKNESEIQRKWLIWSVVYHRIARHQSTSLSFPLYALILKLILERNRVIERSNFSTFGYLWNRIPPFFSAEESMNSCKESPRYHFRCTHFSLGVSFLNEFPEFIFDKMVNDCYILTLHSVLKINLNSFTRNLAIL